MTVFLLIAYILIRPIAYKLLGIPLPHEQKAAEAAAQACHCRNSWHHSLCWGQMVRPCRPGAVGVNEDGLPVDANGEVVVAEGEIEIAEGESLGRYSSEVEAEEVCNFSGLTRYCEYL